MTYPNPDDRGPGAAKARYRASEKGQATERAYRQSAANRNSQARYKASTEGKRKAQEEHRRRTYGLRPEAFEWMVSQQGGACALCPGGAVCVDHDHADGSIRGLLCISCNSALGKLGDNVVGLTRALHYVSQ